MELGLLQRRPRTIDRNTDKIANLLHFGACEPYGPKIPKHEVVIGTLRLQLITMPNQDFGEDACIGDDLFGIGLPCRRRHLQ